jgi:hypothetical protein
MTYEWIKLTMLIDSLEVYVVMAVYEITYLLCINMMQLTVNQSQSQSELFADHTAYLHV